MAGLTTAYEDVVMNWIFHNTGTSPGAATMYVGYTTDSGTTECTTVLAPGYVRKAFTPSAVSSGGVVTNSNTITFEPATTGGHSVYKCALFTSATRGAGAQITDWQQLSGTYPVVLSSGQSFQIPAGSFSFNLD